MAEGCRVAVVGVGGAEPLGSQHKVCLSPNTARGSTLLIACVEQQAEAYRAVKATPSLILRDKTPLAVLVKNRGLIGGEHLLLLLVFVNLVEV